MTEGPFHCGTVCVPTRFGFLGPIPESPIHAPAGLPARGFPNDEEREALEAFKLRRPRMNQAGLANSHFKPAYALRQIPLHLAVSYVNA